MPNRKRPVKRRPQDGIAVVPVQGSWCCTHVKVDRFSQTWVISDFSRSREEIGEEIRSSAFPGRDEDKFEWRLRLNHNGRDEDTRDYVSLFLLLVSCKVPEVRVRFKFSILTGGPQEVNVKDSMVAERFTEGDAWGSKRFIRRDLLLDPARGFLPGDKLTLYCELSVFGGAENTHGFSDPVVPFPVPELQLSDDFGRLFENEKFGDIVLAAKGGGHLRAHKAVLAARSPIIAATLENGGEERALNRLDLTDVEHDVLREMLRFIYTDRAPNMQGIAGDLLIAAHRFGLERLKVMCEEALFSELSVETAADLLALADTHNAEQLKEHVVEFVKGHATDVMKTAGWRVLVGQNPKLVAEAFEALATRRNSDDDACGPPPCKRAK